MQRLVSVLGGVVLVALGVSPGWGGTVAPLRVISPGSPFAPGCEGVPQPDSTNYQNAEVEPWVDVNPTDSRNLIAVWQQDRWSNGGAHGLVTAFTKDGGASWGIRTPHFSRCAGGSDLTQFTNGTSSSAIGRLTSNTLWSAWLGGELNTVGAPPAPSMNAYPERAAVRLFFTTSNRSRLPTSGAPPPGAPTLSLYSPAVWASRKTVKAKASTGRRDARPRKVSSPCSSSPRRDTSVTTPKLPMIMKA